MLVVIYVRPCLSSDYLVTGLWHWLRRWSCLLHPSFIGKIEEVFWTCSKRKGKFPRGVSWSTYIPYCIDYYIKSYVPLWLLLIHVCCGLGGLKWAHIIPLIRDITFIHLLIHIYRYFCYRVVNEYCARSGSSQHKLKHRRNLLWFLAERYNQAPPLYLWFKPCMLRCGELWITSEVKSQDFPFKHLIQ